MNDVIRVYDARDADGAGAGLGVISPTECEVTEAAGGDYVLTAAIPIADGTGWELALLDRQVVATVPVGAAGCGDCAGGSGKKAPALPHPCDNGAGRRLDDCNSGASYYL
ncbi:MAG: hypothetical protein ACLT1X_10845 [Christensenellales bacterium]